MMSGLVRLRSIDVFRAITMFLMIFVNDVDAVSNVPFWIKHAHANEDALGFADVIFPAFLFIVGLSIPFAIDNMLKGTKPKEAIFWNIISRSAALLIMGFIHVNLEHYGNASMLPRSLWEIIVTISFFLIWNVYPDKMPGRIKNLIKAFGWILLVTACFLFKDEKTGSTMAFHTYWWGILGLIGWSYLIGALVYLFSKAKLASATIFFLFFFLFNIAVHAGWIDESIWFRAYFWIIGNGSMPALTLAGIMVGVLYRRKLVNGVKFFYLKLAIAGILILLAGFILRPFGGISKIHDTPSWVAICLGISILFYGFLIWLIDTKQKQNWFKYILPAGTNTLTCYLIPYILYSVFDLTAFHYPTFFNNGIGGIIRSFFVAFVVIIITKLLWKVSIRIKA